MPSTRCGTACWTTVRVVKILNPRLDVTPELNDRFLREARFAIQLRHPNIAQLHDFSIAEDGSAFIVMEFIDGATLEEIVARTGPPPLGLGLEIARQSLKAIGFLHRRGLIHRDISPDNLMLTRDPDGDPLVKMIDLGIAKVLKGGAGGLTSTGMFLGKPRYASPEQFGAEGMSGVDARADLYSFGVVLYELLTGVCPIQGRDPSSLMAGHLFRPPVDFAVSDPQGRLPADLRAILLRALAKSPDERYASAEELSRALGEVQNRYPVVPADLEAVLDATATAAERPVPLPGSTQDKLDQHFAKVATPAPTVRSESRRDSTLVLAPLPRAAVREEKETPPVSREPTPPPVAAPAVPVATPLPPRIVAPPPAAPRIVPKPPPAPPKRRFPLPTLAAILLLALVGIGLGVWIWPRPSARVPVETSAQAPPVPVAPAPSVTSPVAEVTPQSAPPVSPAAVPSIAPPPAAEPVGSTEASVAPSALPPASPRKPVSRPEPQTPATPQPVAEKAQSQPLPVPAPSSQVPATVPTPERPSEKPDDPGQQEVDTKARLVSVPSPSLSTPYKDDGVYVRIVIAVEVSKYGRVTETRVKDTYVDRSEQMPAPVLRNLHLAALEVAGKALFQPAQRDGIPVPYWTGLTFEWGKRSGQPQEPDTKALLISAPPPSYRNLSTNARFIVAVLVDEHGKVTQSRIQDSAIGAQLESSSLKALQEAVIKAAGQATFQPALRRGQPVASWSRLDFQLYPKR